MPDEPYPEVPREVLRPARPPEKRGAISARLRERPYRMLNFRRDTSEAADTIDALVEALGEVREGVPRVLRDEGLLDHVDKALALARR